MDAQAKRQLRRSNAYPSITLREAVDLTTLINRNAGHQFVKLEDIARITNKSVGGMSQKVGTAVQYGLLEMKSGTGYRGSELFKKILKPFSGEERQQSMISAFKTPKLYVELIAKFDGSPIPSEIILSNILERDHSIYDDAAKKAAAVFLENIEDLGIRNSYNELELAKSASDAGEAEREAPQEAQRVVEPERPYTTSSVWPTPEVNADLLKLEIGLTSNKKAVIFYPRDMTSLDIEIIKLQITVLEKIVESNRAGQSPAQ